MKQALSILIVLTSVCMAYGQDIESQAIHQDSAVVYEKVYLHIDREYYAPGDTLWFKAYLVSGMTNELEPGYKNVYVQLISPEGAVISNRLLMSVYGTSHGDIALSDSLPAGQYTVRANTEYLENFGEKSYFHKRIWIGRSRIFDKKDSTRIQEPELGEILFFPEGGTLVENTANHVAFKAMGKDGKGMVASGKITDSVGQTVTTFKTSFLGMGQFAFMPKEGEKYYAKIDNHPEYNCQLPVIQENGLALHLEQGEKDIMVSLSRNYKAQGQQTLTLMAKHKGVVLFYKTLSMDGFEQGLRLSKSHFPLGISKITVLNTDMEIVAERLVFVSDGQLTTVKINTDKEEYASMENVALSIEPMLAASDSVISTLSVAVVNEGYFSSGGNTQTIQSYLLLDSDLKGAIESPAQYFVDENSITSAQKLDLLMMVQGWRSYYWDDIIKLAPKDLINWNDAGITISGTMKRLFREKTVAGGKVQLSSFSPLMVEKKETDSLGRFCFDRLFLKNSAEVKLIGVNEKGHKSIEVIPDAQEQRDTLVMPDSINRVLPEIGIPKRYARKNYFKQLAWQKFDPEKGNILLAEVKVSARKRDNVQQVRFYKPNMYMADDSYLITPGDYKYGNVHDFLLKKAELPVDSWVTTTGGNSISQIVYYLDGELKKAIDIKDESPQVLGIPIKNVYQIDVNKTLQAGKYLPGIRAFAYVYTKKFDLSEPSNSSVRGTAIIRVRGFQRPNKFYSPKYTPENIINGIPDYRPTLFWSPEVVVKDRKASIDFFTCDNLSNYVIVVEGISKNGKICFGVKRFTVNKHRDS
jgi:hypothetical protein